MLCASAIYRLAEEEESRDLVRMHGGLEPLVELVQDPEHQVNKVSLNNFIPNLLQIKNFFWHYLSYLSYLVGR